MLYYEFEKFIDEMSFDNSSEDFWYDVGVTEAQNMLENFSAEDWNILAKTFHNKSIKWQKHVIYSFDGENSEQEVKIILSAINTENEDLFETCIDSLRCLINEENKCLLLEKTELLEKVNSLSLENNSIAQKIYKDFLNKVK